jgi:hypothetical protein
MNTAKTTNNQPPEAQDNSDNPARTGAAKRRIDAKTIAEIARLSAKSLTESEACRLLTIDPKTWFNWKSRHSRSAKFAGLLEEFRAGRINDLVARIEKSANGEDLRQPDWRAASFLLAVADAKRYSPTPTTVQQDNRVQVLVSPQQRAQVAKMLSEALGTSHAALASQPAPSQLTDADCDIVP